MDNQQIGKACVDLLTSVYHAQLADNQIQDYLNGLDSELWIGSPYDDLYVNYPIVTYGDATKPARKDHIHYNIKFISFAGMKSGKPHKSINAIHHMATTINNWLDDIQYKHIGTFRAVCRYDRIDIFVFYHK